MIQKPDYYSVLGVVQSASLAVIKKSYHRLAMQYHPDKNPDNKIAEEKFKAIHDAYDVLKDDKQRKEYDLSIQKPFQPAPQSASEVNFGTPRKPYIYTAPHNPSKLEIFFDKWKNLSLAFDDFVHDKSENDVLGFLRFMLIALFYVLIFCLLADIREKGGIIKYFNN
ncbi:MAG: DnaJ domain-containing protein [Pseudomonadota bacterium]